MRWPYFLYLLVNNRVGDHLVDSTEYKRECPIPSSSLFLASQETKRLFSSVRFTKWSPTLFLRIDSYSINYKQNYGYEIDQHGMPKKREYKLHNVHIHLSIFEGQKLKGELKRDNLNKRTRLSPIYLILILIPYIIRHLLIFMSSLYINKENTTLIFLLL